MYNVHVTLELNPSELIENLATSVP